METCGSLEVNGNKIGRITPAGVITEFEVPTPVAGLYWAGSLPGLTATSGSRKATTGSSDGSHRRV